MNVPFDLMADHMEIRVPGGRGNTVAADGLQGNNDFSGGPRRTSQRRGIRSGCRVSLVSDNLAKLVIEHP